jgi:hypothetical protein
MDILLVWYLVFVGILTITGLMCILWFKYITLRNEKVFNFRQDLITFIFNDESHDDIFYKDLVYEFNTVSYNQMFFAYCKPVNIEFYKHTKNLYPLYKVYKEKN